MSEQEAEGELTWCHGCTGVYGGCRPGETCPNCDECILGVFPRADVLWFAQQMELKLRKHDAAKGTVGYLRAIPLRLWQLLTGHAEKLKAAIESQDLVRAIVDAADVGNFAMMLAVHGRRAQERARQQLPPLTSPVATRIWTLLVNHAGANKDEAEAFRIAMTSRYTSEYRFSGALGSGGKFYYELGRWRVACYPEDETPRRKRKIKDVNELLERLRREVGANESPG